MHGALVRRLLALAFCLVALVLLGLPVLPSGWGTGNDEAQGCLAVGAWVPATGPAFPAEEFAAAQDELGPLSVRRSFDAELPASFAASSAGGDAAAGVRSFVSWKPPGGDHRGAARGLYDDRIAAWARTVPTTEVFGTAFHEPENDMTAAEFVAFQRHVYRVVKAANPSIRWGPVYMAHWWDPAEPANYVGDPRAWWPGEDYADFVGLDWYGADPTPMTTSRSFRHWYGFMAPTGLPLVIAEYGQAVVRPGDRPSPAREAARAEAIRADARWLAGHPQVVAWLYWHGPGPRGQWRLDDAASQAAWREAAAAGCPA